MTMTTDNPNNVGPAGHSSEMTRGYSHLKIEFRFTVQKLVDIIPWLWDIKSDIAHQPIFQKWDAELERLRHWGSCVKIEHCGEELPESPVRVDAHVQNFVLGNFYGIRKAEMDARVVIDQAPQKFFSTTYSLRSQKEYHEVELEPIYETMVSYIDSLRTVSTLGLLPSMHAYR